MKSPIPELNNELVAIAARRDALRKEIARLDDLEGFIRGLGDPAVELTVVEATRARIVPKRFYAMFDILTRAATVYYCFTKEGKRRPDGTRMDETLWLAPKTGSAAARNDLSLRDVRRRLLVMVAPDEVIDSNTGDPK